MPRTWKTLSSKVVYGNPWIKIHEDQVLRPDGKNGIYSYLEKPPGTFIIAMDDDSNIYLIKEYRYPIKKTIIQLPAGVINKNSTNLYQAKKELFEETGIHAKTWKHLGKFYVGAGHETTLCHTYLATDLDLSQLKTTHQEGDEAIQEIVKVSLKELKKLISSGNFECGISLSALTHFLLYLENLT